MNPETFQRVKQVFADALELPAPDREPFIVRASEGNQEIQSEVLSLLRFHTEKSFIGTVDLRVPTAIETQTLKSPRADPPDSRPTPRRWLGTNQRDRSSELRERFDQSTLRLLRVRLAHAIALIYLIGLAITAFEIYDGTTKLAVIMVRFCVFGVLLAILLLLRSSHSLTLRQVRALELVTVIAPILEMSLILIRSTNDALKQGLGEQIPELRALISVAVAIYIAIYGILIPSRWQRTAMITVSSALMPTIVVTLHRLLSKSVSQTDAIFIANPMLTLLMAAVATIGSHIVHQVRREAEAARMYGQYRLTEEIGRGGMGVVYRALHQMLKRPAAIKLIRIDSAANDRTISRFEEEVQISATLSHWNTVQVYDYGRSANGETYYVMEFLDGESLQERLARRRTLKLQQTLDIIIQTCDGLAEAHQRGVVHRDIKPSNLFLAKVGGLVDVIKIVDFGLATIRTAKTEGAANEICGTPMYMSPEQIRGDNLDGRADIYAIGCVAMECLTGNPPFTADSMSTLLSEHLFKIPRLEAIEKMDPRMKTTIAKCLEKNPDRRYANASDFRAACVALQ